MLVLLAQVWGVGNKINERLALSGIHSIQDLMNQSAKQMRQEFGVTLERTLAELHGEPCMDLDQHLSPRSRFFVAALSVRKSPRRSSYKKVSQTMPCAQQKSSGASIASPSVFMSCCKVLDLNSPTTVTVLIPAYPTPAMTAEKSSAPPPAYANNSTNPILVLPVQVLGF